MPKISTPLNFFKFYTGALPDISGSNGTWYPVAYLADLETDPNFQWLWEFLYRAKYLTATMNVSAISYSIPSTGGSFGSFTGSFTQPVDYISRYGVSGQDESIFIGASDPDGAHLNLPNRYNSIDNISEVTPGASTQLAFAGSYYDAGLMGTYTYSEGGGVALVRIELPMFDGADPWIVAQRNVDGDPWRIWIGAKASGQAVLNTGDPSSVPTGGDPNFRVSSPPTTFNTWSTSETLFGTMSIGPITFELYGTTTGAFPNGPSVAFSGGPTAFDRQWFTYSEGVVFPRVDPIWGEFDGTQLLDPVIDANGNPLAGSSVAFP